MFCTKCGIALDESARYCSQCGKPTGVAGGEAPPANEWAVPKRLSRPMYENKLGGVCAGLARHMDVDVTMMRIIWILVAILTGIVPGVIVYVVAWMVMPKDYGAPAAPTPVSVP
jgi:phage shock protein C